MWSSARPLGPGRGSLFRTAVILTALLLFITACGGDDDGNDDDEDATGQSPTATEVTDDTAQSPTATESTDEVSEPTEASEPSDQTESGDGDYSVLIVTGVDSITAEGQLNKLEEGGFDGFVLEGSAKSGHDVYRAGLSRQEADDLAEEISGAIFDGAIDPGLWVWETHSWRSDDFVDETGEVDTEADDENAAATADDGDAASSGHTVSVTVGDAVYEYSSDLRDHCTDQAVMLSGTFSFDTEGTPVEVFDPSRAITINFGIPVEDWEDRGLRPPFMSIHDTSSDENWQAGDLQVVDIDASDSEFTSWELADGRAQGTANFVDMNAYLTTGSVESVSGSFDIFCSQ